MSTALEPATVDVQPTAEELPYLFSVEEFYRMIELEIFPEEARVGLWEGGIYEKMSKTQAHAVAGMNANKLLSRIIPEQWSISHESPITVGPKKAPLPDMVVLRGIGNDYSDRRPDSTDVGLVVEFSLTSLKFDTGPKLVAYAEAGIPAYWILNLIDGVVHVYSEPIPSEGRFATMAIIKRGESFPFALDGVPVGLIAASDLLPPP